MQSASVSVRHYAVVTAAYWAFTLTDGALRMLVLLHFHTLGYSPLTLALLFTLYEVLGAATNLFGGYVAVRTGLRPTLIGGLMGQVVALGMLAQLSTQWSLTGQVVWIVAAQGISGIAKDFTKLSAKSAIKFVAPDDTSGSLFRWVALLTGSKNALKGVGFFLGGALLVGLGFEASLWAMAVILVVAIVAGMLALPRELGRAKAKPKFSQLFGKSRAINQLSAARVFLFGSRDVWFVVALPVFLRDVLGWRFDTVGATMAAWVIAYGAVQAFAPRLLSGGVATHRRQMATARLVGLALAVTPVAITAVLAQGGPPGASVLTGLAVFGVLFAMMSSLHSYLIVAYSEGDNVAADVGFYYMANAIGRLVGTVLSGLMYQLHGLAACLWTAAAMLFIAAVLGWTLPPGRADG